jgi:hypothetical protein
MRPLSLAVALCLLLASPLVGQTQAPTLTELDKLRMTNALLVTELAKLRAEQARREYEQAVDDARNILRTLQREGYTLDLQTMTYRALQAGEAPK